MFKNYFHASCSCNLHFFFSLNSLVLLNKGANSFQLSKVHLQPAVIKQLKLKHDGDFAVPVPVTILLFCSYTEHVVT